MEAGSRSEEEGAELLAQLGYALVGAGYPRGLTPAQWAALRFLSHANRFSRTVSAFAEFHATTRGTASQTVQRLVDRGFVRKNPSLVDGRSIRLDLTKKGRETLGVDPLNDLVAALGSLPPAARARFVRTLKDLVARVAHVRGGRSFGTCPACLHFDCDARCTGDPAECWCNLFGQPLDVAETDELCVNYQPAG
jgi:DNA-binding MarR family transcriptional regulator